MPKQHHNGAEPKKKLQDTDTEPQPNTIVVEDEALRKGFVVLPRQILFATNLSAGAKILFALLLGYAWEEGSCFPGQARLCEDMQAKDPKTMRRFLKELENVGLVSHKQRGLNRTNVYYIHKLENADLKTRKPTESRKGQYALSGQGNMPHQEVSNMPHQEGAIYPTNNKQGNNTQINSVVVEALIHFGISEKAANKLASEHTEEYIAAKVDLAQWLVDQKSSHVGKNPAGYLRRAIEEDYTAPSRYLSPEDRAKREEVDQQRRRQIEEDHRKAQERIDRLLQKQHPAREIEGTIFTTESAWTQALGRLQAQIPQSSYETWLRRTWLLDVTPNGAFIAVPNAFTKQMLDQRLYRQVAKELSTVLGRDLEIEFVAMKPTEEVEVIR